ncbi:MAG TPA: gamma-glutamyltransferase, partial [Burkholderiaceae bacterium]|nr:gamma-glutamyltransferase [Burkholderiaceae bacterium]
MNQHPDKPASRRSLVRSIHWFTPAILAIGVIAACGGDGQGFTSAPEGSFLPPELPSGWIDNKIKYANRDMVAAANPLAVDAGVAVLARGGTAVDAAIAVQMVLNLVEPQSSGVGGGAFMVYFDKATGTVTTYDGRETAPAAATANQFLTASGAPQSFLTAVDGGLSVGT